MGSQKYSQLEHERGIFLERARVASELTLPLVIRPAGANSSTEYATPWQSVGPRGVTNLASNLMLSLFPASTPFFRLLVSDNDFDQFEDQSEQIKAEVNETLSEIERSVLEEIEDRNLRPVIFEVLKNLIISGNSLVYVQPDGEIRNYTLEDYVVSRDMSGNVLDIIVKEFISQRVAEDLNLVDNLPSDEYKSEQEIEIHTCVSLNSEGTYDMWQEVDGVKVADTEKNVTAEEMPWLPVRLTKVTGESYGRGYVEGLIGDLKSLEALQQAIVEGAAVAAKVVFMVNPGSETRAKDLSEANNGDVIVGNSSDITTLQVNKTGDLSVALQAAQSIENKLSFAFNLLDSTLPTSGTTTATEINAIVNSLEKVLAGVYSMLASEFMSPLVSLIIKRLSAQEIIPSLPEEVKLIISTGVSALGRSSDIERIVQFSQIASQVSPEAYQVLVDQESQLRQLESAVGVDVLKSSQVLETERQEALQREAALLEQQSALEAEQAQENTLPEEL